MNNYVPRKSNASLRPSKSASFALKSQDTNENETLEKNSPGSPLPNHFKFRGGVDTGYGRGGKKLGIPTANLPESLFSSALQNVTTGVYFGWATIEDFSYAKKPKIGRNVPHKAVVNVGYSPTFAGEENPEKIIEAHLILENPQEDIQDDFYEETMKLILLGFLREEKKFDSFPDLIAQIQLDISCAKEALTNVDSYVNVKDCSFLNTEKKKVWIGKDGGDDIASWEFCNEE